jgi:iron complex outermembrane receptor protein
MNKLFIVIILFCSVKQAKTQVETHRDSIQSGENEIIYIDTNKIEKIIPYPPKLYQLEPYIPIEEVIIRSFLPRGNKTNTANTLISKESLELQNMGQDIPMLLQNETGIISTSDAGNGIGYTGIRVRGSDATRTNISINGVPINDAESQGVFWVNMPDLVSSTKSVFIQRGVGSSVHGSGAFGGSVLIQTQSAYQRSASIDYSIGSFGTEKITGKLSSGFRELSNNSF